MTSLMPKDGAKTLTREEIAARLLKTKEKSKANTSKYMIFNGREGRYAVANGTEDPDTLPVNAKYYLNIFASTHGYICWKDSKVVDSTQCSLLDEAPDESDLADHDVSTDPQDREGWRYQYVLTLKSVEDGEQYALTLGNASSTRAFGTALAEIVEQMALYDPTTHTPIVSLGVESFKAQGHKNYKPRIEVVGWEANPGSTAAIAAPEAEAEAEAEQPKLPSRKKTG
jgi:hypothetical protein